MDLGIQPPARFGQVDKTIFKHPANSVQAYHLIHRRLVGLDGVYTFSNQVLDKLRSGRFVFDQNNTGLEAMKLFSDGSRQRWVRDLSNVAEIMKRPLVQHLGERDFAQAEPIG